MKVGWRMEREEHIKTIETVQKFIYQKDFESLKKYIDLREIEIKNMYDDNKSSDYIDELVDNLK